MTNIVNCKWKKIGYVHTTGGTIKIYFSFHSLNKIQKRVHEVSLPVIGQQNRLPPQTHFIG